MRASEKGVSDSSTLYFHVASPGAKRMFFYPICTGHFYCDKNYEVNRSNFDNYLILFVIHGSGFIEIDGKEYALGQGSIAFIDCHKKHRYYTDQGWEIRWLHFDGPLAREYFSEITNRHAFIFNSDQEMSILKTMERIFEFFNNGKKYIDEAIVSNLINNILTIFLVNLPSPQETASRQSPLKDTLYYISEHIDEPLPVEMLAERIFLSKYHFIRLFKKEVGYTPHQYILMGRINAAMLALKTTSKSIKDISLAYGFPNESSFCTTFKRFVGVTPRTYRLSHSTNENIT